MQKGHLLEFECVNCQTPVSFSVVSSDLQPIECEKCKKKYLFNDPVLVRQLKKFQDLCKQIHESEEILGMTNVGIDINGQSIKVPYRILLTRLNSSLDLMLGNQPLSIRFRIEPSKDLENPK
jgi:hypothetical protein